jgi:DNA-binding NtrC family response regulator
MTETVLVVEDDQSTRHVVCQLLRSTGYEVREATNGIEALEILTREAVDLVITDFVLPFVDGFRLVELMQLKWPNLPTIVITAYLSAHAGKTLLGNKAAEVFSKPIKLDELLKTVEAILEPTTPM